VCVCVCVCVRVRAPAQGGTQLCLLSDLIPGVIPTQKHYVHIGQILESSFLILCIPCMMQN